MPRRPDYRSKAGRGWWLKGATYRAVSVSAERWSYRGLHRIRWAILQEVSFPGMTKPALLSRDITRDEARAILEADAAERAARMAA